MTNKEALDNAIKLFQNPNPVTITPLTFEWRPEEERNKEHTHRMARIFTAMGEGNQNIIDSGEAYI